MKKLALLGLISTIMLTGCTPWNPKDPFNNPTTSTDSCQINGRPMMEPIMPNPDKVANWGIQVEVDALRYTDENKCVTALTSFQFHLYGTSEGKPAYYHNTGRPLPHSGLAATPWRTDVFVPRASQNWMIDLIATAPGSPVKEPDVTFFCNINILDGAGTIVSRNTNLIFEKNTIRCKIEYRSGSFV